MTETAKLGIIEYAKNAAVVIAVMLSVYQGSSFISGTVRDVNSIAINQSRLETRLDKAEESLALIQQNMVLFNATVESLAEISKLVRDMERTVIELSFRLKERN